MGTVNHMGAGERAGQNAFVTHFCGFCGTSYTPKRRWQKFCSARCRVRACRERQPGWAKCPHCNKRFPLEPAT